MEEEQLKTGELSRRAGVNKETVRFYERKGLLRMPERTSAGYRVYNQRDAERVIFIKNAQKFGFSLSEIRELLDIADGEIIGCGEVRAIAENKLQFVRSQIDSLKRLERVLGTLIKQCSRATQIDGCPIIESIAKGEKPDEG